MSLKEDLFKKFPIEELDKLKTTFPINSNRLKYFDYNQFLSEAINEAFIMGITNKEKKCILDISCGTGYFAWVCREIGHDVVVTDHPNIPYEKIRKILNMPYIVHTFTKNSYNKLPFNKNSFDYIKATRVLPMSFWIETIWENFLYDCYNILKSNGIVLIYPNVNLQCGYNSLTRILEIEDIKKLFKLYKHPDGAYILTSNKLN